MRIEIVIAGLLLLNLQAQGQSAMNVGDIAYDTQKDNPKFQLCNPERVAQGYEVRFPLDESRRAIHKQLWTKFTPTKDWSNQTGYVTIRFVVNCYGLTDRFRETAFTSDLVRIAVPEKLSKHLISIVREVQWPPARHGLQTFDYYHFVTFRIANGKLEDVIL